MKVWPFAFALTVTLVGASCGTTSQSPQLDGGAGAAGSIAGASGDSPCDAPNAFPVWGKVYSPERDCLETETPVERIACNLVPGEDEEPYPDPGFHCLKRLSDGVVLWGFSFHDFSFDARHYEPCDNRSGRIPQPCYAEGCHDAPQSSCSLQETRKQFACNAEGGYDENCCGRARCEVATDCESDEECRWVPVGGLRQCWDNEGNPCDCGGPAAAFNDRRCVPLPVDADEIGKGCEGCSRRPRGKPQWLPAQAVAFVAEIGSSVVEPQAFFDWQSELFGETHTFSDSEMGFLPGVAHDGPYESEISSLAEAAGLTPSQALTTAEFSAPSGIIVLVMIVPGPDAPSGRSPDFEDGPILPNDIFPIRVGGGVYRDGVPYDLNVSSTFVGYDAIVPPINADGASHFFMAFGENTAFGPDVDPISPYEMRLTATDAVGDGWEIHVPFSVSE